MPGKAELVETLQISAEVVELELALLDEWHNDPSTTADRRAEIRLASNFIGVGPSSALRRTAHALNEARAMSEGTVVHPPGDAHNAMVQATADSVAVRSELPGPMLSDPAFTNAMLMARNNSEQAAENSETILLDCTQAGAPAPPAMVSRRSPLRRAMSRVEGGRSGRAARPRKRAKAPKRGGSNK